MTNSRFAVRTFGLSGLLVLLAALPGLVLAQATGLPAEVEGKISDILLDDYGNAIVTVMGIDVYVDKIKVFDAGRAKTPSFTFKNAGELRGASLPGRASIKDEFGVPVEGFIGGTAISIGTTTLGSGFVATDLFVEVAENVVLGSVTSVDSITTNLDGSVTCDISVEGTPVILSTEYRTKFGTPINGSGFEVKPCTLVRGDTVSVEGYFGDGALYIWALESDDADVVQTGVTTVSRASCDAGKIEVRGSSTLPSGTALINSPDPSSPTGWTATGSVTLISDALTGTSIYRYRDQNDAELCPPNILVESHIWDLTTQGPVPSGAIADSYTIAPVDVK